MSKSFQPYPLSCIVSCHVAVWSARKLHLINKAERRVLVSSRGWDTWKGFNTNVFFPTKSAQCTHAGLRWWWSLSLLLYPRRWQALSTLSLILLLYLLFIPLLSPGPQENERLTRNADPIAFQSANRRCGSSSQNELLLGAPSALAPTCWDAEPAHLPPLQSNTALLRLLARASSSCVYYPLRDSWQTAQDHEPRLWQC